MSSDPRQFRWGRLLHTSPHRVFREMPLGDLAWQRWVSLRASGPELLNHHCRGATAAGVTGGTQGKAGAARSLGGARSPHPPARHALPPADDCLQARASDASVPDRLYELRVKVDGRWERVDLIHAPSHALALREAAIRLTPAYAELPIQLEQLSHDGAAQTTPPPHGCGEAAA